MHELRPADNNAKLFQTDTAPSLLGVRGPDSTPGRSVRRGFAVRQALPPMVRVWRWLRPDLQYRHEQPVRVHRRTGAGGTANGDHHGGDQPRDHVHLVRSGYQDRRRCGYRSRLDLGTLPGLVALGLTVRVRDKMRSKDELTLDRLVSGQPPRRGCFTLSGLDLEHEVHAQGWLGSCSGIHETEK